MRLLLDTNIFVFYVQDRGSISRDVMTEDLTLISSDTRFPFYESQGLKLTRNW